MLVNQGFAITKFAERINGNGYKDNSQKIEVKDINSDEESSPKRKYYQFCLNRYIHRYKSTFFLILGNETLTLTKPQVLKLSKSNVDMTKFRKEDAKYLLSSPKIIARHRKPDVVSVFVQTIQDCSTDAQKSYKAIQTDEDKEIDGEKRDREKERKINNDLRKNIEKVNKELADAMELIQKRTEEILVLNTEKINTESTIQNIKDSGHQKDRMNKRLQNTVEDLRKQIDNYKHAQVNEKAKMEEMVNEGNKTLINALKKFESEKNVIVAEYKELLNNERSQYAKSTKELQMTILNLESQLLDRY